MGCQLHGTPLPDRRSAFLILLLDIADMISYCMYAAKNLSRQPRQFHLIHDKPNTLWCILLSLAVNHETPMVRVAHM